jgi:hypothetical protein
MLVSSFFVSFNEVRQLSSLASLPWVDATRRQTGGGGGCVGGPSRGRGRHTLDG